MRAAAGTLVTGETLVCPDDGGAGERASRRGTGWREAKSSCHVLSFPYGRHTGGVVDSDLEYLIFRPDPDVRIGEVTLQSRLPACGQL